MTVDLAGQQWILVVDDDNVFRSLITEILNAYGYTVYEARSAREATDSLRLNLPILAIVDYRLPETDGLQWITSIREQGINIPIVFLSGTFCDKLTFNKLRHILQVSLILQKPIVPELFMEQIEGLIPKNQRPNVTPNPAGNQHEAEPTNLDQLYGMTSLKHPPQLERALKEARKECALELPDMVRALTQAVQNARAQNNDLRLMKEASNEAHKLKGTAGSFSFMRIAEDAEKIESLLKDVEPTDDTLQEIVWLEIIRHLADAEQSANEIAAEEQQDATVQLKRKTNASHIILLVADSNDAIDVSLSVPEHVAEVTIVPTLRDALMGLKIQRYDAIFIDHDVCENENILDFTRAMRQNPGHESVPFAIIGGTSSNYDASDLLYLGCSMQITRPLTQEKLVSGIRELLETYVPCLPRVLTVDDDPVLTGLIQKILATEGMEVRALNHPIQILEALESFHPDIVLLDVIMPGLSGYDVCRMLRGTEKWKDLSIIFLTSKSDAEGRSFAKQAGGDDSLAKPVVSSEVISRVKSQVQRSPLIRKRLETDPITGLLYRETFETAFARMIESSQATNHPLTVCLMEIENFGMIKQVYGAETEASVLAIFGKLLRARFRAQDAKAQLNQLFVLLIENDSIDTIEQAILILLAELQAEPFSDGHGGAFNVSLRFGMSQLHKDTEDNTRLLEIALERMRKFGKQQRSSPLA